VTVCLIACCGPKVADSAPVRHLYTSPLFRKSVAFAERNWWRWAVLSAKHGVVQPDDVLDPYDQTLSSMTAWERFEWAGKTRRQLEMVFDLGTEFVVLAGKHYRAAVAGLPHTVPMAGLGIGRQLQWLTERLA
jgi:hypothetical protein